MFVCVRCRTPPDPAMLYRWWMTSNLNSLLSSPRHPAARPYPGLSRVELVFGQVLQRAGQRITHVYFPTSSLVSILSDAKGEVPVEVGVIGRDGMVGVPLALGEAISDAQAVVQASGAAMRSSAADFTREFAHSAGMRNARILDAKGLQAAACKCYVPWMDAASGASRRGSTASRARA